MRMMPGVDYDPDNRPKPSKQETPMEQEEHTPSIRDELGKIKDSDEEYGQGGVMESVSGRLDVIDNRIHELLSILVEERTLTKEQAVKALKRSWF